MLLRPVLALTLFGALGHAVPAAAAPAAAPDGREIRTLLTRIHDAASKQNFQGTFVVSGGGAVSSARIAHYGEGSNQYERIESLDGQARYVYRHNEVVHTLWPGSRVAVVEQAQAMTSFPALLQGGIERLAEFYDVVPQGSERVAGREAQVLLVQAAETEQLARCHHYVLSEQALEYLTHIDWPGGTQPERSAGKWHSVGQLARQV